MLKKQLLDFPISIGRYNQFVNDLVCSAENHESLYACMANVHMFVEAYRDKQFLKVMKNAEVVSADGKPLTWALRLLHGVKQDRVAGMDLMPDMLHQAALKKLKVFFYGGSSEVLERTSQLLQKDYPGITAAFHSPPFRMLTKEEDDEAIKMINDFGAHIVFVVLGCPKQEKWMAQMKGKINAVMVGVGGALPVLVGMQKRAPLWMQKSGLEWGYRLMQEPQRLFKRYAVTNSVFLFLLASEYMRLKLSK